MALLWHMSLPIQLCNTFLEPRKLEDLSSQFMKDLIQIEPVYISKANLL
jgi:hypothetical protein